MNRSDAAAEAKRRWGPLAFARIEMSTNPATCDRFEAVVGVWKGQAPATARAAVEHPRIEKGRGPTFEAAFEAASPSIANGRATRDIAVGEVLELDAIFRNSLDQDARRVTVDTSGGDDDA